MSGIKEWYLENEQALTEDFCQAYDTELESWCIENAKHGHAEDLREFAEEHPDFMRWLECEYGSRGAR